jgi:DNA repair protein RadC
LKHEAVNVIILHNHPSGDPTPSREDIIVTRKVKNAGELVDIKLLDHIIIGDNKYVSLANEGLL